MVHKPRNVLVQQCPHGIAVQNAALKRARVEEHVVGDGPQFVIDPYTQGFATGLIAARVLLTVDVAVLRAEAFVYSQSIT